MFGDIDLQVLMERWAHDLLTWIGFGTLVGLLAKAIMPGRDPGGAVVTVLMGIGGSIVGCGVLMFLYEGKRVTPISPIGFLVATGGALILLFFYKLLAGKVIKEGVNYGERIVIPGPHSPRSHVIIRDND
jgi:uncharacterized membrane protein YeaQ/YmgE (transglycosylase-associated protein family)